MIDEICAYLNNYFDRDMPKYYGDITISNGALSDFDDKLQNNQYFRIVGSVFNDGVYKYPVSGLTDETFKDGAVWAMALPPAFLEMCTEIKAWQSKYGSVDSQAMSPFSSESFGGYSYSKASGGGSTGGNLSNPNSWESVYASRLARWRKL